MKKKMNVMIIIMEMMILTLEAAGVEYDTGLDEGTDEDSVDKS